MVRKFNIYKEKPFETDSDLRVRFLAPSDFKYIETKDVTFWKLLGEMKAGSKCLGLIGDGMVLSYLWVSDRMQYLGLKRMLKKNECYFYNSVTKPEERGKGYAEILRAKSYEILKKQGKDTFYSVTDLKNKSALRFKEKIGAEVIERYTYVKFWKYEKLIKDDGL